MITYAKKRTVPSITVLENDSLEFFMQENEIVVMAFLDVQDSKSNEAFANLADDLLDYYSFAVTHDPSAALTAGVTQPGVIVSKQYDDRQVAFNGEFTEEAVEDFIHQESIPVVGHYSQKWSWRYIGEVCRLHGTCCLCQCANTKRRELYRLQASSLRRPLSAALSRLLSPLLRETTRKPFASQPLTPSSPTNSQRK